MAGTVVGASAQVYSVNVAGYVTMQMTNGLQLINNPLDADGTGTNNSLYTVFGQTIPNLSVATAYWQPTATYSNCTYLSATKKWSGPTNAVNAALQSGKGIFLKIIGASITTTNVTVTGTVRQGALTNTFPVGLQILSSMVPQGGGVSSTLGFSAVNLDKISRWDVGAQKFANAFTYIAGKWSPSEPIINVGESFFITTHASSKWIRNFTVQ